MLLLPEPGNHVMSESLSTTCETTLAGLPPHQCQAGADFVSPCSPPYIAPSGSGWEVTCVIHVCVVCDCSWSWLSKHSRLTLWMCAWRML